MDINAGGDAGAQQVQYITSDEQQYVIQQDDAAAGVGGQSLLQGAKIVDGNLVLPENYATDSGETVILVYETPDGQQFMTQDGQQIVFEQEGAEGGLIDPSQMVTQIQDPDQQQFVTMGAEEGQQMIVTSEAAHASATTEMQIAPGQSLLAAGITMAADTVAPGQSLLAPTSTTLVQQTDEHGNTTIVSDPQQIAAVLAGQQVAISGDGDPGTMAVMDTEGMTILSQAVSAVESGDFQAQSADPHISVQSLQQDNQFPQTVKFENYNLPITNDMINSEGPTTLMADGKEIQVRVLSNAEFAASHGGATDSPPLETLKLRDSVKSEAGTIQIVTQTDAIAQDQGAQFTTADGQIISEAQLLKGENGEQVLFTTADPNSAELAQFIERIKANSAAGEFKQEYGQQVQGLVIAEAQPEMPTEPAFGPGVINPETGLMEEPEDSAFTQKEDDKPVAWKMQGGEESSEVKLQVEIFNEGSNKAEVTIVNVPVKADGTVDPKNVPQLPHDTGVSQEESDDSDFDEENLTPKVVYERLLAQHRRTKECQVCGELLENFLRLKEHLMEHAGYNPCECQKCGRILSTPEGRYRHEKAHDTKNSPRKDDTPREKITCPVCGKQIARKEHLKRHMLIHQDCPTYKCLLCGYSFKREDLIKGHVKKFHPKQVEASSLELLFEKSTDDTAPQRSQWNPHRVYREKPKTPRIAGRGRGRPRKSPGEPKKPGIGVRQIPKTDKLIIRSGDGSIVVPKDETDGSETIFSPSQPPVATSTPAVGPRGKKRPVKTPKRFVDDEEYDEDAFNSLDGEKYDDDDDNDTGFDASLNDGEFDPGNTSDDHDSPLLVRYAPEGADEESDSLDALKRSEDPFRKKIKHDAAARGKIVELKPYTKRIKKKFKSMAQIEKEKEVKKTGLSADESTTEDDSNKKSKTSGKKNTSITKKGTPSGKTPKKETKKKEPAKKTPKAPSTKTPKSAKKTTMISILKPLSLPLWADQKTVRVSFVGQGEEMTEKELQAIRPSGTVDIEEEIVVVMGGKGSAKVTSVKQMKTPQPKGRGRPPKSANTTPAPKAPSPVKKMPASTKKLSSPLKTPKKSPKKTPIVVTSRSGRVIQRRTQPDGEVLELPKAPSPVGKKATPKPRTPLKKLAVELEDIVSTPPPKKAKKTPASVKVSAYKGSKKRSAKSDSEDFETPNAKKSRIELEKSIPNVDPRLISEIKTVKVSTPLRNVMPMKTLESNRGRPPKLTSDSASPSVSAKKSASSKTLADGVIDESCVKTEEQDTAEYGTVTIEKGRIVGEITLGMVSSDSEDTGSKKSTDKS